MMRYTHVGFRREAGHVHTGRLYGHKDYRGRFHALKGTLNPYGGAVYVSLCGKSVVADHDGYSFNVAPTQSDGGEGVSCRRCRALIAKAQGA